MTDQNNRLFFKEAHQGEEGSRMNKKRLWLVSILGIAFLGMALPPEAQAIPAWARKYNADCSLCHYPAVPRLNKTGQQFRWAGYRMPDEFGKPQDVSDVGHFLSLRGRGRARYRDNDGSADVNRFEWHDATFFYAGAITESLSSFTELEWEGKDDIGLVAQVSALFGHQGHFSTLRFGQFHTLQGVGIGGFDRPTGISRPEALDSRSLTSSGIPFRIRENQKGLELAHARNNSRILVQALNGLGIGENSGTEGEQDRQLDFLVAYEQILDDLASGFTLYGYRGVWHNGTVSNKYSFSRYGLSANKIFEGGAEVIGAYFRSDDNVPAVVGEDVSGNSFFVALEQFLERAETTLLARFDWIDPDDSRGSDTRQKQTLGIVHTFQRHMRLALEVNRATDDATDETHHQVLAEAMINF